MKISGLFCEKNAIWRHLLGGQSRAEQSAKKSDCYFWNFLPDGKSLCPACAANWLLYYRKITFFSFLIFENFRGDPRISAERGGTKKNFHPRGGGAELKSWSDWKPWDLYWCNTGLRLHFTQISFENVTQEKTRNPSYSGRSPPSFFSIPNQVPNPNPY